jgi:hypothetical protein
MGCDIHSFAERKVNNKWEKVVDHFSLTELEKDYYKKEKNDSPFDWRNYSMFAFLANVRNYDCCEPISEPKGIPYDVCDEIKIDYEYWKSDAHSCSYLMLKELLDFDYEKVFLKRRISRTTYNEHGGSFTNGASLAQEWEGTNMTYRENLGDFFFIHLNELKELGNPDDVRIVFWFDN